MNTIQLIDRKGVVRLGKKVVVSTIFDCNINEVWQHIQNISTLVGICKPMAKFTPYKGDMPTNWIIGKNYVSIFTFIAYCLWENIPSWLKV